MSAHSFNRPGAETFIGNSPVMARVHRLIGSVAPSMATVFITGESGTGKELAAQAVHTASPRAAGPFVALNCGAIPLDLLESEVFGHVKGAFTGAISDKPGAAASAHGGTLFLDEVCEMAPALQTKLLRFLQTSTIQPVGAAVPRPVDVRIVCATNRDPVEAMRRGLFREDLFYRLYVVPLHMPPLRERGDDVIEIAETALARFAEEEGRSYLGLDDEVRTLFRRLDWPGNVRQLLNVIRNVVVLNQGGQVRRDMLPASLAGALTHAPVPGAPARGIDIVLPEEPLPPAAAPGEGAPAQPGALDQLAGRSMAEIERMVIEAALARHAGSVPLTARELDLSPSTLYRKIGSWKQG